MGGILLVDHYGLIDFILRDRLRLLKIVGRDIDAVTCLKSGGDHPSLFGEGKDLVPDVKEVEWAIHLSFTLINPSINLLTENGRHHFEFFCSSEHANVAFMHFISRLPFEIFPLCVEGLSKLQHLRKEIASLENG